jgi:hypothetical protein
VKTEVFRWVCSMLMGCLSPTLIFSILMDFNETWDVYPATRDQPTSVCFNLLLLIVPTCNHANFYGGSDTNNTLCGVWKCVLIDL